MFECSDEIVLVAVPFYSRLLSPTDSVYACVRAHVRAFVRTSVRVHVFTCPRAHFLSCVRV